VHQPATSPSSSIALVNHHDPEFLIGDAEANDPILNAIAI